jgi:hypothetical protein
MAEITVSDPRLELEVEPLSRETALALMDEYVEQGYRVELYSGKALQAGGRFYSLKVLVIEPVLGADLVRLVEIAEAHERPLFFNETEGVRVR